MDILFYSPSFNTDYYLKGSEIITLKQVIQEIAIKDNKMFGKGVTAALLSPLLASHSIFPIYVDYHYTELDDSDDLRSIYSVFAYHSLVEDSTNNYKMTCEKVISQELIEKHFREVREIRNKLLQNTDWMVTDSSGLSANEISAVKAYRQILRDCVNIATYPHEVHFPAYPKINIPNNLGGQLTREQVEKLKNHKSTTAEWILFLIEWERYNFTTHFQFVSNLAKLSNAAIEPVLEDNLETI